MDISLLSLIIQAEGNGMLLLLFVMFAILFFRKGHSIGFHSLHNTFTAFGVFCLYMTSAYVIDFLDFFPELHVLRESHVFPYMVYELFTVPFGVILLALLTKRRELEPGWIIGHTTPFLLAFILSFFFCSRLIRVAFYTLSILYGFICCFLLIRAARKYMKVSEEEYSSMSGRSFRWMIAFPFLLILLGSCYLYYLYYPNNNLLGIYYAVSIIIWGYFLSGSYFMLSDRANAHTDDLIFSDEDELSAQAVAKEDTSEAALETFRAQLKTVCEDGLLYLQEGLTRDDLALAMGTNHTYISKYLPAATGMNFYNYINTLRIQHAKRLFLEHPEWSIERVAYESGYRNRITFTNAFQRIEGINPIDYKTTQRDS